MTKPLFNQDAYLKACTAKITNIDPSGGIILDQTVFYPTGGGQPGDSGTLTLANGEHIKIATTIKSKTSDEIIHIPVDDQILPKIDTSVEATINWDIRHKHMRMHSAMHLVCAIVPCGVTGGQVGADKSRLDFDIGEHSLDKQEIGNALNEIIAQNHNTQIQSITTQELDLNPELVRTMSVQPPRTNGQIRLIKIGDDIDLQPCGGTHVNNSAEIGKMRVSKIENKGKRNRRVHIVFDD
jgi:misacylated tRNA(Ala) deacylase